MSLRIAVVDDNTDLVESMLDVLQHLGHQAVGATNASAGLQLLEDHLPDVALIDVSMPGMSGVEVAKHVRGRAWGQGMVLIALTGWGREEDRDACRDAGFDHLALKPVDLDYLQVMLGRVDACSPHSVPVATQAARTGLPFDAARP